jgi:hypothetical protein
VIVAKIKCFIRDQNAIPEFARLSGINIIDLEFLWAKAEILDRPCVFDADLTVEQIAAVNDGVKRRLGNG